jgi:hypothetical protein
VSARSFVDIQAKFSRYAIQGAGVLFAQGFCATAEFGRHFRPVVSRGAQLDDLSFIG